MLPHVLHHSSKRFLLCRQTPLAQPTEYPPGESLCLIALHDAGRIALLRLADDQVNVFGHNYITDYHESVALPNLFADTQEQVPPPRAAQPGLATLATASDEVEMLGAVVALEAGRHKFNLAWEEEKRCDAGPHRSQPLQTPQRCATRPPRAPTIRKPRKGGATQCRPTDWVGQPPAPPFFTSETRHGVHNTDGNRQH